LGVSREQELEDPRRRHNEREVAPEVERRHVRLVEREAGRDIGGQRVSPLFCKTQHRRREVDADDLVTVRHEGRGHPTGAAPHVKDRSACLPGQSAVEVDAALARAARDDARRQGVVDLGVQAVGLVKGARLAQVANPPNVDSNGDMVNAFHAFHLGW
jgi:hypothetical protein